jgi:site-specific DNA-methyltransferase (adenine-specific)
MKSSLKPKAPRNRTVDLSDGDKKSLLAKILKLPSIKKTSAIQSRLELESVENQIIQGDCLEVLESLPDACIDLLILDPPYNLTKNFNGKTFKQKSLEQYANWFDNVLSKQMRLLKPGATVYVCSDWYTSSAMHQVLDKYLIVRNRITWEREKGRGAQSNWKNCHEDIWYCTVSDTYTFNLDAVKQIRQVIAPYTDNSGKPKDWKRTTSGDFRLTHPSNMWTDITIPFWSMKENTEHPTQKPEKLIAKLIMASSNSGDLVLDPFNGSGTTCVVAAKLGRKFIGLEENELYCLLALKRLEMAKEDSSIQGYNGEYFLERNMAFRERQIDFEA